MQALIARRIFKAANLLRRDDKDGAVARIAP
jgi:hypothetical protein